MIKRKSYIKLFSSLLVFSLIFSVWLPKAFANTNLDPNENSEIATICDEDIQHIEKFEIYDETAKEDDIIDETSKEGAINDEVIANEIIDEVITEKVEVIETEENNADLDVVEESIEETIIIDEISKEKESVKTDEINNKLEESFIDENIIEESGDEIEDMKSVGLMPIIPLPKVGTLSNGGLEDTIEVSKSARRLEGICRQFEVKLEITGEPQEAPVDVVLIIDKSGSMNETSYEYSKITSTPSNNGSYFVKINGVYKAITYFKGSGQTSVWRYIESLYNYRYVSWNPNGDDNNGGSDNQNSPVGKPFYTQAEYTRLHYAKNAAISFAGKVLGSSGIPGSRISVVAFSGPTSTNDNGAQNQAQTIINLSNNLSQITNVINGITASGGTNTEAGFLQGRSVIENSNNPYSNKVVIMFTDGLPTASNGNKYAESTDINYIHNQRAINAGKGIFVDGVADVFTIGLLQGMGTVERNLALQILNLTQNKGFYEAPSATDLDQIFAEISTLLGYAATNAKVLDKIGNSFDLVQGSLPSNASYNNETREISWNPGTIIEYASLTYRLVAKNNASGEAYTNESAKLTYTDVFGTPGIQKNFTRPKVNIPTLLELQLTDANIILGDSISLGSGVDAHAENYMTIFGGDGNGTYTYEWRIKGNSTVISTERNPSVSPIERTTYTLTVKDSNNCIAVAEMTVEVRKLSVSVKKILDGNYADYSDKFDFEIVIDNHTYTFTLGHEEHETIENIARDSLITLSEDSKDYEVSVIVGNETIDAIDGVYTIELGNEDITILVTNYREATIDTGINLDNLPYVILLSSTFLGFGLYMTIKRKKRD